MVFKQGHHKAAWLKNTCTHTYMHMLTSLRRTEWDCYCQTVVAWSWHPQRDERTTLRTPFESLKLGCPTLCGWIHWHTHAPLLWVPGEPMCSPTKWEEEGSTEKIAVPSHESLQSFLLLHPLVSASSLVLLKKQNLIK